MKHVKRLLLALVILSLAVGCQTVKKVEQVLRVAKDNDVASLDTNVATDGLSFEVIKTFTEGLLEYDAAGVIIPGVATKWVASTDGKVYTFTLRNNAKWSNGDPVTANDFVFSWRRLCDPALATEYSYMASAIMIKNAADVISGAKPLTDLGVKAINDTTFEVTLDAAVPYFIQLMTFPIFHPLNEKFVTAKGAAYAKSADALLSNGPWTVTTWTEGTKIRLDKNPNYWNKSKINLTAIEFLFIKDYQTAALEFENGNVDIAKISSDLVDRYKSKDYFFPNKLGYTWYVAPNQLDANFKNENLRLALALSFDKTYIVDSILHDGSNVADYIVPIGLATGPDGKDFRTGADKFLSYNVAKAQEYWAAAKTELGVTTLSLELLVDDAADTKSVSEFLQAEWQKNLPGLTITIQVQPKKNRLQLMRDGTFQLGLTRWGPDYADPFTYLGDLFQTGVNYNYGRFSDPAYDALIQKTAPGGALSTDPVARWTALHDAEKILLDQAGILPAWQSGEALLISTKVTGVEYHVVGQPSYRNVVKK
jgi:oligopeptide transport system substrate-binding protein